MKYKTTNIRLNFGGLFFQNKSKIIKRVDLKSIKSSFLSVFPFEVLQLFLGQFWP